MSRDHTLRSLARRADSGDLDSQARSLLERVRAGTLTRERLELAAYCGHEGARAALGPFLLWPECACGRPGDERACVGCGPLATLDAFVGGLDWRWRTDVLVRACLAAAVPAAEAENLNRAASNADSCRRTVRSARDVMEAWLAVQNGQTLSEWASLTEFSVDLPGFLPRVRLPNVEERRPRLRRADLAEAIYAASVTLATRCVGGHREADAIIREAIQRALIAWALCPSPSPPAPRVAE